MSVANNYVSQIDKKVDLLDYVTKEWNVKKVEKKEDGFILKDGYMPCIDSITIYPKALTGAECDTAKGSVFGLINSKHEDYMEYRPTQLIQAVNGLDKTQAKNKLLQFLKKNEIQEDGNTNQEEAVYLYTNNRGNLSVNTSLLAEYIRQNSNYYIVKKQGSDSFFIYWYEDGYYKELSPNELKAKIKALIPLEIRKPSLWEDAYKDLIATDNFISYSKMSNDKYHINFQNGLLDTRTWELKAHSPKYNHTYQLKCDYNPEAKEPKLWKQFIDTLADYDKEVHNTLQEWFGLIMSNYNANICKKAIALSGVVGNTGKSKFLKVMARIIGVENISSKPIQDLSARFGAGALYGKKCVLIDDQKATNIEDGSTFKAITGDGVIEVELKGKEPFSFEFNGGITFTCNGMPYIKDDKGSHMFERFLIIPCNNVIPEDKRDKRIFEKMEAELEGIALWALEGLKRLISNNFNLTEGEASKKANKEYRALNDTLFRFISEQCITTGERGDRIPKTDLELRYEKFCIDNGITSLDKKNIKDRAEKNGILCKKFQGIFCYQGLKYKEDEKGAKGE